MSWHKFVSVAALGGLLILPAAASAQSATTGSIAGAVKDVTGAVLAGVTVEAASPALIEKVRTVVTDAEGQYKIIELRPGTYSITFTLTGFSTVKREVPEPGCADPWSGRRAGGRLDGHPGRWRVVGTKLHDAGHPRGTTD